MDALDTLKTEYQILTELHGSEDSRTYLARHLTLNRDVTLTVARAVGDKSYLNAFARDVELLKASRDQNLIPIIEGRWLDDQTYAVARARVRGSTLDQLMSAVGTMPPERIALALREITSAILCARSVGVTSRRVSPESVTFQQGTGKALVAFEPSRLVVDDAQTIRELAATMGGGRPVDVSEYLAMLAPSAAAVAAAIPVAATTPTTVPVGKDDSIVVVQQGGMGFGARVLTTFAVIAAVVVAGLIFMQHRKGNDPSTTATTQVTVDSSTAAGDLATRTAPIDTNVYPTPTIVQPPMPVQQPVPAPAPYPSSVYPSTPYPAPVNPQPYPLTTNPTPIPQPTAPRSMPTPIPEPVAPARPPVDTVIRRDTIVKRDTLIRRDSIRAVKPVVPIDTVVRPPKPDSIRPDTMMTTRP